MKLTCSKVFPEIPFAHRQPEHSGHCAQIHGHNFSIKLTFSCDTEDDNGFVVDFGKLGFIKEYFAQFDHACVLASSDASDRAITALCSSGLINPVWVKDPSAEGLAKKFFFGINKLVQGQGDLSARNVKVVGVEVFEDSRNSAYYGE